MNQRDNSTKFLAFLAIIATALSGGAFALSWQSSNRYFDFSRVNDGFVAPRDIAKLVEEAHESTVQVNCVVSKKKGAIGTGWAIDSELLNVSSSKTTVMTNHHVIEDCIDGKGTVTINRLFKKEKPARILAYDEKNDLAVLETDVELDALELSENPPWPGYWVMVVGSADGYEGSVAFGNVLNVTVDEVLITNNVSSGNSGGPLIDNEGKVVGMVSWGINDDEGQYNGAKMLDVFCVKILKCEYEYDGEKTWFEYGD